MVAESLLPTGEFYSAVAAYMMALDPAWEDDRWRTGLAAERLALHAALGRADGRTILDCSCGAGGQAVPLAQLGWHVTAIDLVAGALATAHERARREGVTINTQFGDMRDLSALGQGQFDAAISRMALDNITDDREIARALGEIFAVLKPGGHYYLRLRDFDHLLAARPRFEVKEERPVPHGRVIRLEDWSFEEPHHAICTYIFLHENRRREGYRWRTDCFAYRRRALRKTELAQFLRDAGFGRITFLSQRSPWAPYEVTAERPPL